MEIEDSVYSLRHAEGVGAIYWSVEISIKLAGARGVVCGETVDWLAGSREGQFGSVVRLGWLAAEAVGCGNTRRLHSCDSEGVIGAFGTGVYAVLSAGSIKPILLVWYARFTS